MNLKGLKITRKMYKRISEIGVENIKNSMLHGLEEFKHFNWSNFTKQEFGGLIHCINYLDSYNIFNTINDSQLFIFNYYTDVTEMDIVTVLRDENDNNIVIDIEYKSGSDFKDKLDEQLVKRIQDHMSQLFLNEKYIVIAMSDYGFYRANYYNSEKNIEINSIKNLKNIFKNLKSNDYVEPFLTQANDLAGIHNLYSKMESHDFKYYEETKKTTEFILHKIKEGIKAIVCMSSPGTGKTVVAFKLFFENNDTVFLILNQKFYNSLELSKYFLDGRCFFGSDTFVCQDLSNKIVIIDEAQRLSKEKILEIVNLSKATIIFGDHGQSFMPNDLNLDAGDLVKYLKDNGIYVHKKELKRSKRYNDSVEKALNFLSSRALGLKEEVLLEDYKINIFYDHNDFLSSYHSCKSGKKMYTTFDLRNCDFIQIGDERFLMADREFYGFSISTGYENYIGHTLHAISFDVENNYVLLKNVCVIRKNNKDVIVRKDSNYDDEEQITKFLNELNILFTRGKKSLNIYSEDLEVYLYLNKKLKSIHQKQYTT